jgi:hypothetical protein
MAWLGGVAPSKIFWAVVVLLGVFFLIGVSGAARDTGEWAGVENPAQDSIVHAVDAALQKGLAEDHRVKPGFSQKVAWFKTDKGRIINIWVAEADFSAEEIGNWKRVDAKSLLLVNSVDEMQSIDGGISRPIGLGCNLEAHEGVALSVGDVTRHACNGRYKANSGVTDVANVAIITGDADRLQHPACFKKYDYTLSDSYRDCVTKEVTLAMPRIIELKDDGKKPYDNMIVPALGTGTGQIEKAEFYRIFFRSIISNLQGPSRGADLPSNIYLQVWSREDSFPRVIDGVRDGVEASVSAWRSASHEQRSKAWLRLAGAAGGLALLMVFTRVSSAFANWAPEVGRLASNPAPIRLLAWLVISYGLADAIVQFLPYSGRYDALVQLGVGLLIAPLSAPLAKALRRTDKELAGEISPPE